MDVAEYVGNRRALDADAHLATQILESAAASSDAVPGRDEIDEAPHRPGHPTLEQLLARAQAMGLPPERYLAYANHRWGRGWRVNPHGRGRAWDELIRYQNDPSGYLDKIEVELAAEA